MKKFIKNLLNSLVKDLTREEELLHQRRKSYKGATKDETIQNGGDEVIYNKKTGVHTYTCPDCATESTWVSMNPECKRAILEDERKNKS